LKRHPDSQCDALKSVDVDILRCRPDRLDLRFCVRGAIGSLLLPPPGEPGRADQLWRHTCFEAFIRASGIGPYFEFNFSPSRQWGAYSFEAYRSGMQIFDGFRTPGVEVHTNDDTCKLAAVLELSCLSRAADWYLGLSAVIEERNGRMSYWALAHPPGKPDFHHADCFALKLPAPWSA
jgi:hypothetical protein